MRKVLIADSSAPMRKALELAFGHEGVQVVSTADGAQAVELLPVERPDALLVERTLPGRTGFQVAAFVRSHPELRRMAVVMLVGAFETVDRAGAVEAGVDDVFTKPVDLRRAVSRLRELTERTPVADTDVYLDRLSAALEERERRPFGQPAIASPAGDDDSEPSVPTLASILGEAPSQAGSEGSRAAPDAPPATDPDRAGDR